MRAALNAFDSEIAGVVQRGIVLRLDEHQFVEHCISVARSIHQQLGPRIECDKKILIAIVAGLNEMGQGIARPLHLIAAHRS